MDLNQLYFRQQRALMQAADATDAQARKLYQSAAACFSRRIIEIQCALGAAAASQSIDRY